MARAVLTPAAAGDAAAVTALVIAVESRLYGSSTFAQGDLEQEWAGLDVARDARVVRDGGRVVGYAAAHALGPLTRAEACVHPDARGRGLGTQLATWLEEHAACGGAHRIQNSVLEDDAAARALLTALGYRAVRVFREMRIELDAAPTPVAWPPGLRATAFDPARDARAFHAAQQEAFGDHWDYTPRDFAAWSRAHLEGATFDPALWCVARAGDEVAGGTISVGDTYGGGFVHALFTRRPWRRRGLGAALLEDAFGRLWARGERSVGLGVDAASDTGAFRLYERAGMRPALGWVMYEKPLGGSVDQ